MKACDKINYEILDAMKATKRNIRHIAFLVVTKLLYKFSLECQDHCERND